MKITAAKITKGLTCDYAFEEKSESKDVTVSSEHLVHDDLRAAFRQLVPHLALICEEVEDNLHVQDAMESMADFDPELPMAKKLDTYKVNGFKLTGEGESGGVVIIGQKVLKTGDIVNLNTPNLKWDDEYQYINELRLAIEQVKSEVTQYDGGKVAPDVQGDLFAEEEQQEEKAA